MSIDKKSALLKQWRNRNKKNDSHNTIVPRPADAIARPSAGQQRLWLLQQLYPDSIFYQYAHQYLLTGTLDLAALQKSFDYLIRRHEILRSRFEEKAGKLSLKVEEAIPFEIQQIDFNDDKIEKNQSALDDKIIQLATAPFDLKKAPLIRAAIISISGHEHRLILSIHHIIGDRLSLLVLNRELFECYEAYQKGEEPELPALPFQYADFTHWKSQQQPNKQSLNYWLQKLSGELSILDLPKRKERPSASAFIGKTISQSLSAGQSQGIRDFAQEKRATPFVFFLTLFKILLFRYTQQKDILIGSPFSNRDKKGLDQLIGFFNETVVLRSQLSEKDTFESLVNQIKKMTLEAFEHRAVSFDRLVKTLQPERHGSINPLFQAMFVYNAETPAVAVVSGLQIKDQQIDLGTSKFDMTLFATAKKDHFVLSLEYAEEIFSQGFAKQLLGHLMLLVDTVLAKPTVPVGTLKLLSSDEQQQLLQDWSGSALSKPNFTSVVDWIQNTANKNPEKTAVVFQDDQINYRTLDYQSNQIAKALRDHGVGRNQIVGLYTSRSTQMMIGLLGILKAGAAYLPLDPEYPDDRILYMIDDAEVELVLTNQSKVPGGIDPQKVFQIDEILKDNVDDGFDLSAINSDDLAYMIYTSGSTGKPKGVSISHANLLHSNQSRFSFYEAHPKCFLLLSSFSFDSSVAGIYWTLCHGGTLLIAPKRIEQDVVQLGEIIYKNKVSHTLLLPSLYQTILQYISTDKLNALQHVMVAGEVCPLSLVQAHYELLSDATLYNEYGPTEATVWCIAHRLSPAEKDFVSIGQAIPGYEVYILDEQLQLVPIDVPGQIYIGGPGLSSGYWKRPALTQERFLENPFSSNGRIYKTGDLGRYHADGRIEFLGRGDQQVKVRGFRVEPQEIEKVILQYPEIDEAVVEVYQEGEGQTIRLAAFIAGSENLEVTSLKDWLKDQLPDYMVPADFVLLTDFPRLPNGKIDRKKLIVPEREKEEDNYVAPINETEQTLVDIWESVLARSPIGVTDNFFSIGGDSILSIQVISKARDAGLQIRPSQLFEFQEIKKLAQAIENNQIDQKPIIDLTNSLFEFPLTEMQQAFLFNSQMNREDDGLLQLQFFIKGKIEPTHFQAGWQQVIRRHTVMRTMIKKDEHNNQVQVVTPVVESQIVFKDWRNQSDEAQQETLQGLLEREKARPLDFSTAPVYRAFLIQLNTAQYLFLWTCHHLFLDGWSCGIVFKDLLTFYQHSKAGRKVKLAALPTYPDFLHWQNQQSNKLAGQYWKSLLDNYKVPLLFDKPEIVKPNFDNHFFQLGEQLSEQLSNYCQQEGLSLSVICQGVWALLLSRCFDCQQVVCGMTVSGRFADFPKVEELAGLLMNVIPVHYSITEESPADWLRTVQRSQGQVRPYEHNSLEQIKQWINWPQHVDLFDTLFVFGNFLKDGLQVGDLEVTDFEGGFSSAYPLTIRVNPINNIAIDLRYNTSIVDPKLIEWTTINFQQLLENLFAKTPPQQLKKWSGSIPVFSSSPALKTITELNTSERQPEDSSTEPSIDIQPRNNTEEKIAAIWVTLFNRSEIRMTDHFFHLGGKSIMAIRLFAAIEKELGEVIPPVVLLSHPTIRQLSDYIRKEQSTSEQTSIVPMRSQGDKTPLFCLHGGGGHVFFYQELTNELPVDQPVYSLQPVGLDGIGLRHESIEAMAAHYISEIKTIQPKGPYQILGTCFSNAVALEIAHQLKAQGESLSMMAIIDSAPAHLFGEDESGQSKTFSRFKDMLQRGDFSMIKGKIKRRIFKQNKAVVAKSESASEKNLRLTIESLNKMYAKYEWRPYDGKIHFFRSGEFAHRKDKNYHLIQWEKLAKGGLEVAITDGHHISIFEQPEVKGLAKAIEKCLQNITVS